MSNASSTPTNSQPAPMSVSEARKRILDAITPVADQESLPLRSALHRVLASAVGARVDVPPDTNSAMDGYAVRSADAAATGAYLELVGASFAGHPFSGTVQAGQCVRIMTGAVLPDGADAVIAQEDAEADDTHVRFHETAHVGKHVRHAGESLTQGQTVLSAGRYLTAADIGLLASVGIAEVSVYRLPRVAFFTTGDELAVVGEAPAPGRIYDSNRYTISALLRELGLEVHDFGIVRDTPEAVADAFAQARHYDAIISSGGVSVGDADYVVDELRRVGDINYWKVAVKPGKPQAFGHIGDTVFFGLPGNPVSTMVGFMQFVRPALVRLCGNQPAQPVQLRLPLATPASKDLGRLDYQRGILLHQDGETRVKPVVQQGSGVLRSMSEADCFIVLEADCGDVDAGQPVTVEPFAQPVWNGRQ